MQRCRLTANVVDKLFTEAEARNESIGDELAARLQALRSDFDDPEAMTAPLERWMTPTLLTRYQEALLAGHELQCQAMLPNELSSAEAADPLKRAANEKAEDAAFAAMEEETRELPARGAQSDLHHQCHRKYQCATAQNHQDQRSFLQR